jgi:hypothetical protein
VKRKSFNSIRVKPRSKSPTKIGEEVKLMSGSKIKQKVDESHAKAFDKKLERYDLTDAEEV